MEDWEIDCSIESVKAMSNEIVALRSMNDYLERENGDLKRQLKTMYKAINFLMRDADYKPSEPED